MTPLCVQPKSVPLFQVSMAVIKCHNQSNSQKKEFNFSLQLQSVRITMAEQRHGVRKSSELTYLSASGGRTYMITGNNMGF